MQLVHGTALPVAIQRDGEGNIIKVVYLGLTKATGGPGATAEDLSALPIRIIAWGANTRRDSVADRVKARRRNSGN